LNGDLATDAAGISETHVWETGRIDGTGLTTGFERTARLKGRKISGRETNRSALISVYENS